MTYAQYEAALAAWRRAEEEYYSQPPGSTPDPGPQPQKPKGYDAWRSAGKPGSGANYSNAKPYVPRDWIGEARVILPWLPEELLKIYVDEWKKTGGQDDQLALAKMRADPAHAKYFPGFTREDGSFRFESEQAYLGQLQGYAAVIFDVGVNPDLFERQFIGLIEGEVAIEEFSDRVRQINRIVSERIPQTRQWYAETYGRGDISPEALLATALDPDIGQAIFTQRITQAEIAGEAAAMGFMLNIPSAQRFLTAGLDAASGREFFGSAAAALPALGGLAGRLDTRDTTVDLSEYASGTLFAEPAQRRRLTRLLAQSRGQFSGGQVRVERDQLGSLTGLAPR